MVISAKNGKIALQILKNPDVKPPDIIFLDLNMPVMNGWQCLDQIRKIKQLKQVPIIIYSTSGEPLEFEKVQLLGNVYFLTKPTKLKEVVCGITCVLNNDWNAIKEMNKRAYL